MAGAPSALIFFVLFIAPMRYFFVISFWQVEYFELSTEPTTRELPRDLRQLLADHGLHGRARHGDRAAHRRCSASSFRFIARFRAGEWAQALLFIVLITLFGGYLMKIYAWKTILGNEGVLNTRADGGGHHLLADHLAALQPAAPSSSR